MSKIVTSAFGEAKYPHLTQPDTMFNQDGIYQVKLIVPAVDAEKDIKIIDDVIKEELIIQGKKYPNKTDQFARAPLPYQRLEDGKVQFHFKTKFKPKILGPKMKPLPSDKQIWGGSIIACSYKPVGYYVASTGLGCTLRLNAVQVETLVESSVGTAGFSVIDGVEDIA